VIISLTLIFIGDYFSKTSRGKFNLVDFDG